MQGRTQILMLAALLCAPVAGSGEAGQSAQERQAQPRSSSSSSSDKRSGASQSSAARRHAQPRASGASRSSGGSATRHQAPSVRRGSPPVLSGAQSRQPRPGTGTGYRYGRGYRSGGYYPYYPAYRYPWYSRYHYSSRYPWYGPGFGLGLGYGSAYYGYYPYYGGAGYAYYPAPAPTVYVDYRDPDAGWVRVQVQPPRTRVYVDGHLAGSADDFDGMGQGLTLEPGRHELTLELDGYRTHRVMVYVSSGVVLKVRHDMQRGAGGPTLEDLTEGQGEDEAPLAAAPAPERDRDSRYARQKPVEGRAPGVLRLSVTPADASVYVDGAFMGSAEAAAELALAPGAHRIEVVRPGYDPWVREIELEASERRELVVELPPR
jgi:hypothetical protein